MDSKNDVIKETKTEIRKLTLNDRCLIRAFLGYEAVENLHAGVKQKINASIFTRASLWPDDIEENNQMGESNNEKTTPPPSPPHHFRLLSSSSSSDSSSMPAF